MPANSADASGVRPANFVDNADFPCPLTAGCAPEDWQTRSDPGVATMPMMPMMPPDLEDPGREGTDNEVYMAYLRENWARLPDAALVRAYLDTPPESTFVNRRQRRIIMDCLIERVLRIKACRISRHSFANKVDDLFAGYPEWNMDLNHGRIYQSAFKVNKRMGYIDMFGSFSGKRLHRRRPSPGFTGDPL